MVQLVGLIVALYAVAYAIVPYSVGGASCSPAVVQVTDRGTLVPGTGTPPLRATSPCTREADHRLYVAGPVLVLDIIALAGLAKILA